MNRLMKLVNVNDDGLCNCMYSCWICFGRFALTMAYLMNFLDGIFYYVHNNEYEKV